MINKRRGILKDEKMDRMKGFLQKEIYQDNTKTPK